MPTEPILIVPLTKAWAPSARLAAAAARKAAREGKLTAKAHPEIKKDDVKDSDVVPHPLATKRKGSLREPEGLMFSVDQAFARNEGEKQMIREHNLKVLNAERLHGQLVDSREKDPALHEKTNQESHAANQAMFDSWHSLNRRFLGRKWLEENKAKVLKAAPDR